MLPDLDIFIRCDYDPYGIEKLFSYLKIGAEVVMKEQYYTPVPGAEIS